MKNLITIKLNNKEIISTTGDQSTLDMFLTSIKHTNITYMGNEIVIHATDK